MSRTIPSSATKYARALTEAREAFWRYPDPSTSRAGGALAAAVEVAYGYGRLDAAEEIKAAADGATIRAMANAIAAHELEIMEDRTGTRRAPVSPPAPAGKAAGMLTMAELERRVGEAIKALSEALTRAAQRDLLASVSDPQNVVTSENATQPETPSAATATTDVPDFWATDPQRFVDVRRRSQRLERVLLELLRTPGDTSPEDAPRCSLTSMLATGLDITTSAPCVLGPDPHPGRHIHPRGWYWQWSDDMPGKIIANATKGPK